MTGAPNIISLIASDALVRVSKVVYRFDVLRPAKITEAVPLGVFVDMRVEGRLYGLGLMARSSVSEHEIERVGVLARPLIEHPFDFLLKEYERLIGSANSQAAFVDLPNVHSTALFVAPPEGDARIQLPRHLRVRPDDSEGLEAWAKDSLLGQLTEGFWNLLDEHWPGANYERDNRENVQLAA